VRAGTRFEKLWYSRKHHALYAAFAPDVIKTVSACKAKFDYQKEKESYSDVNCNPFKRIPGNCYGADQERDKVKKIPVEAVSGRMFCFEGKQDARGRHGGVFGKER
jgi:hypothetical protein